MERYTLRRYSKNRVEQVFERIIDNTVEKKVVTLITDQQAKLFLKFGDWQKKEVLNENGTLEIIMQKILPDIIPGWLQDRPVISRAQRKIQRRFK